MHTPNIPADSRHNNDTDRLTEEEIYWLGKLSPDLSMSSFAVDHKMVRAEIQNTEIYTFKLSDEISRRITAVSKGSEYGVFIILLCGIQYLLSIHSGNKDVVVGIPVFRTKSGPAFQGNHLIIRNVMDSRMTFKDLLFEVKQTISDAGKHQKVSYSKLAKLLHLETPAGDLPKPRTVVLLENIQNNASAGQSAADTTFQFNLAGEHIHCRVSFKTGGITQETIRGIANHFNHFFRTVLDNPDILLSGIGIPDEERSRLLYEFNETAAPYPKDKTVVDWFEEQVERTPHQTAVVYQNRKLTYRELNAKANQIAYLLIGHGIGEGSVVGIMVERSLEMPVGMMGILKTGGAYLPIDPSLPKERIRSLLNNSQAGIILVNGNLEVNISDPEMKIVDIGSALASSVPEAMDNPGLTYDPEGMMYVLFTSGTTGVPKGVMVKRRSFVNLLNWYIRELKLSDADDLMLIAPLSFDTAHKNLFAPLLVGGRLHLFTAGMYDYNEMSDVIARERITVINCSPSALYPLIDYNENNEYRKLSPLKHVIVGGEPINLKKLKPWLQSPECRSDVINTYGPTECTDIAASFKFNRLNMEQLEIVPLGKPLPNTEIYIVDEDTNLQPIGVAGELCISGDGLSLGYYNAPNLTNEKFVECPFYPGKKIYKTGDLARWMQDGTLEFLGRKDFQTKIRGFRVELGEVEHCLLQHPGVEEAIAVSMKDSAGMDVLCAYFVSRQKLPVAELRSYVAQKLPDFMIPAYFTQLDKMPLNNNGKIDRKALPAPDPDTAASSPYAAPESNMERLFAGIWEEVLGVARVGIHDDFFELGGHSLKAAAIVLKINRELETSLQISGLFRHPNIRAFAKYAESLQGRQYPAIRPVETTGTYPVPSQQKRLFILWQLDRSSLAYNMTSVNMIEGGLDRRKLEDTLGRLIRRHESLRTSFIFKDGELVQTIRPDITFTLEFEEAEEIWLQRAVNDFVKPFDLEKEPLFRVKLMKVGDNRHLLLTDIHHIVFDGASMDILMQEFSELYSGMSQSELELQYKDYSVWQAEQNAADDRRRQEAYWLNLFKDGVPELQLNTDYPRQPVIRFEGGSVSVLANAELTASLRAVAAESGATLYMLLLSAVNALLFKYTGQEDVVIGSPTAGRSHPGLERIVGMFVNTVVMRNFPCGGKTFNALLGEVKENTLKAFENEQYPFEVLVDKLGVPRNTGRNPLYDVIFAQESDDRAAMDTAGLSFREYPVEERSAQIDLSIRALEKRSTLDFRFKYRTDLFAEETIARMAGHFIRLLEEIAQNRDVRLQDIRILSDQDERLLLEGFNNTQTEFPYEKTVHELIGRQVRDTPTETAIVYKDRQLTYAELDEQANRLARVLRNKGVKRNDIIGIIAEPSAEMVISVLGVLKSGGAYLPIDPGFPVNRIRYMLEDSRCSLIVTQRPLQEFLKLDQIALDDESLSQVEASCPENVNLPGDLAYVIYTSGTTGKPKGVMIEHRNMTNQLAGFTGRLKFDRECRHLFLAKFTFDVSVQQMLLPLLSGGQLYIPGEETAAEPGRLWSYMAKHQINVLCAVPAHMKVLLNNRRDIVNHRFRYVMLAGEVFSRNLYDEVRSAVHADQIVNLYGPTEATIYTTYHICDGSEAGASLPIGRPLDNYRTYILDRDLRPVPLGVAGELYISGAGVGRGYLNRPDLTRERFVPDPFLDGASMYKTGDLVRWLPDGGIEYMGRLDHQVKIKGIRIEPGEINHHLLNHGSVNDAVVAAKMNPSGEAYLCAYVVAEDAVTTTELREYLGLHLSGYMIPERFVQLAQLPATTSGKIDIKALQEREDETYMLSGTAYAEPSSGLEQAIAEIWKQVLGTDRVGVHDHFFELGGNSLNIIEAHVLLKERLNVDLPVVELFRYSSIHALARRLGTTADEGVREGSGPDRDQVREESKNRLKQRMQRKKEGGKL